MSYLVFSDLDGTLLNKDAKISQTTKDYFKEFTKNGNTLVLTTGRSYSGCIHIYRELELNSFLICDNGGFILKPNDKSFKPIIKSIPLDIFHEFFHDFKDKVASCLFNYGEQVYTYKYIKEFEWLINQTNKEDIIEGDFDTIDVSPAGLMLLVHNTDFEDLEYLIKTKYKNHLFARSWGRDRKYTIFEVCGINSHKGSAIEYVIECLQAKRDKIIAFGDGMNDLEMLKTAPLGIAMKNAYSEAKEVADIVIPYTNEDNGVVKYLQELNIK